MWICALGCCRARRWSFSSWLLYHIKGGPDLYFSASQKPLQQGCLELTYPVCVCECERMWYNFVTEAALEKMLRMLNS